MSTIYPITYAPEPWQDPEKPGVHQFGSLELLTGEIIVAKQDEVNMMKTLVHEMLHGICYEMNILEIREHKNMERIIETLAVGIVDTLVRNKMLK